MKYILRSLLLAVLALSAQPAAAIGRGQIVTVANAASCISTVGATMRQLGQVLNAAPSTNAALLSNCTDKQPYRFSVVSSPYLGTFNGGGYSATFAVSNGDNCNTYPAACGAPFGGAPASIGFFANNQGTIQNIKARARILTWGTMLDGSLQTWRVGVLAGFNAGTINNYDCGGFISGAGYFSYHGCIAESDGGTVTNGLCNLDIYLTVTSQSAFVTCAVAYFRSGSVDTLHVTGGNLFTPSGFTPGHTQQCSTPPCEVGGSYTAGALGTVGYSTSRGTATNIIVDAAVTVTNATASFHNQGTAAGIAAAVYWGTLTDSTNAATVNAGSGVSGGVVGSTRYASGSSTPSLVQRTVNTGTVNCGAFGPCGGLTATNAGQFQLSYNLGTVNGASASVIGGAFGTNYTNGQFDHIFNWGNVFCSTYCGGIVGYNLATADTGTQAYSISVVTGGSRTGGAFGNCGNNPGITLTYWGITTSGLTAGCGSTASPTGITGLTTAQLLAGLPAGFDGSWLQNGNAGGYPYLVGLPVPATPPVFPTRKYLVITPSTTSPIDLSVAAPDFNCTNNMIQAWGPGGNGGPSSVAAGAGGGGGSGAYATRNNFCPSGPVTFTIGTGGSLTATVWSSSSYLKADNGKNGLAGGTAGGAGTIQSSVGSAIKGGANGGIAGGGVRSGGGGGGAPGPNGSGAHGGNGNGDSTNGGGGGGAGAEAFSTTGGLGNNGSTTAGVGGGDGGNSFDPTPPITASFTASMSGNVLSISAVNTGTVALGAVVSGTSVPANTVFLAAVAGSSTDWTMSTTATISSESMTSATPSGGTVGGAGSPIPSTPAAAGSNGSGAGAGSSTTSAASAGATNSCNIGPSGIGPGSGAGGGGGLRVTLPTGGVGGSATATNCVGGGAGGGGGGITNVAAGGTGGDGVVVISWVPLP